ncbi:hypothetical protein ACLNGM_17455 [Aureimonas phyllosphaerae]|uniref:hypothetical protein n=1 Tax=Aureimonas phyllosphaerae TaxID=1166078 RepID=UPI003A5BAE68
MFREFCTRLLAAPHPNYIYMRIPEPVLRVDLRPDGSPELSYCYSWRCRFEARPSGGGPVPFIFPLPAYDEALAFRKLFNRTPTKTTTRPVLDVTSVFSPSFDEWSLKVALVHMLSAEEGPLALLPTPTIEAGVRVTQLLDLWCMDTVAARSFQHGSFLGDCGELLDGIARPIFGRPVRQLLHRFSAEIVDRLRQHDHKSAAAVQEDDHVFDASGCLPSPG